MLIEKTDKEILIRLPAGTDITGVERLLEYLEFKEIASKSQATQEQIDQLAGESKKSWWEKNRNRLY